MGDYKHIFFDLDRTLWDFEQNATDALIEMYLEEKLDSVGIPDRDEFIRIYRLFNRDLWQQFKGNEITKDYLKTERFYRTLKHFGVENYKLAERLGRQYITISPTKRKLFPYSIEILQYLREKYQLHILTNGFKEVQFVKLEHSGLSPYFNEVITSEAVGYKKPDSRIFDFAIAKAKAFKNESIMIGDDAEADIKGAQNAGIDQVYVNFNHSVNGIKPTFEVNSLKEIEKIL